MQQIERQQSVLDLLRDFKGLEPLKQLFWSELNYERINQPLSRRGWTDTAANALAEDPILFSGGGEKNDFHVIYARLASDRLLLGQERPVASRLLRDHPYALFVFSNSSQDRWHFINVKYETDTEKRRRFRRITVGPEERLRTASERLSLLDLSDIGRDLSPLAIQERHDEAFDVEAVTKQFFDEYKNVFDDLQNDLLKQTKDKSWAHDYALQFLNRCMFLYFIQRKGWLGEDKEFLRTFWESYRATSQPQNSFVNKWVKVLFFEAFNQKFHLGHKHFPAKIKETLSRAPFLNGGLFTENELDTKHDFLITDSRFERIFNFLERYNFTIAEDSPLDQEVAVDPEVIGRVYESLVNISEEADERGDAGIFYTPRTEIDLMCRLALVDHLANHLGNENKSLLYQLVFALEPEEKEDADKAFSDAKLWSALNRRLHDITVLDPACGSGSFLVGMLHVLDNLQERANRHLNIQETPYERKKRIIGQSLYGVDVMDWACHVAELRLWLGLVVDAELTSEELHLRREPLLPHFTFKIRCGDSLVQEVGGISFGHNRQSRDIPKEIQNRITKLKTEKLKFYNNDPTCQFKTPDQTKREEIRLFQDILDVRRHKIQEEIKFLRRKLEGPIGRQLRLDGKIEEQPRQIVLDSVKWQRRIEVLSDELSRIDSAREALKPKAEIPFVWDIAFVEIFESEKGGFDIVIGNPPYVRQENISDPHLPREKITTENKKEYKTRLARSVYQAFPKFFGYRVETDTSAHKLDAKSDLYIYFYFHGLSLLNPEGSFCFITSNSWLDVGYGKDLQEFLLKHSHIKMILDNQAKRSFAQADVNTVIVLFSAPDESREWALDKTARFVMFKVPFEHILSPVIFDEIESANDRKVTPEYRIFPAIQKTLLEDGWKWPEDTDKEAKKRFGLALKGSKYGGNKWGGKYLRAPDIYCPILNKGNNFLRQLSYYFNGERYLNTGGADGFFIITKAWKIGNGLYHIFNDHTTTLGIPPFDGEVEREYLLPLIKDYTKKDKRIEIQGYDAYCLVIRDKPSLRVKKYKKWGKKNGYHLRSVTRNQKPWYKPTNQMTSAAQILVPRSFNDTFIIHFNPKFYLSLRFYRLHPKRGEAKQLISFLNSTLFALILETLGNKNLGQGVLDFFMADFLSLRIPVVEGKELEVAYEGIKNRPIQDVKTEYGLQGSNEGITKINPLPDRRQLDETVFDALHLTKGERDAVYEAVINLVEARLKKASSLDPKDRQKRSAMRDGDED